MGANAGEPMALPLFLSSQLRRITLNHKPIPPSLALELWSFNVSSITRILSTSLCVARVMIEGKGETHSWYHPNQFDPITATTNPFLFQLSRIGQRESRSEGRVISTPSHSEHFTPDMSPVITTAFRSSGFEWGHEVRTQTSNRRAGWVKFQRSALSFRLRSVGCVPVVSRFLRTKD